MKLKENRLSRDNVGLITLAGMEIELSQILGHKVEIHTVKRYRSAAYRNCSGSYPAHPECQHVL